MIDVFAAPIENLLAELGTGNPPPGAEDEAVRSAAAAVTDMGRVAAQSVASTAPMWTGPAAQAANQLIARSVEAGIALASHGDALNTLAAEAGASVARGNAEIQTILSSFLAAASAVAPTAVTPAGQTALVAVALEHLDAAIVVYTRVRAELDALAARVGALVLPSVPSAPTVDDGLIRSFLSPTGATPPSAMTVDAMPTGDAPGHRAYDPAAGGTGATVTLPDGSTALAPNEKAAAAVRFALDQQGTPYVWGGTTPGQGLDCSGLTQSAYGHAGVEIPRLAADQSIGTPVGVENLMPGDLAVWDGHVAMVVGNGQMVEAGDPVSVSPVRTSNSGMGFHGFFRPTE